MILAYFNIPTNPPRPRPITPLHQRVVALKRGKRMILERKEYNIHPKNAQVATIALTKLYENKAFMSASAIYGLGG